MTPKYFGLRHFHVCFGRITECHNPRRMKTHFFSIEISHSTIIYHFYVEFMKWSENGHLQSLDDWHTPQTWMLLVFILLQLFYYDFVSIFKYLFLYFAIHIVLFPLINFFLSRVFFKRVFNKKIMLINLFDFSFYFK